MSQPWPLWPQVFKTTSSHIEGCERLWSVNTKSFEGFGGKLQKANLVRLEWVTKDGRSQPVEKAASDFAIDVDLVLLAMGFVHVVQQGLVEEFSLETDERGNIRTQGSFHTSNPKVWAAGDARNGASLVVRALADGKASADAIGEKLL
jgi:glutamate synthase (NADPH/NADH) small chain